LGVSDAQRRREREMIGQRVVAFLQPDATAFDTIGVDPDRLFGQLQRGAQS
jgi:hypothetical protein